MNDGAMPYGSTVVTSTYFAQSWDGVVTTELISATTTSGNSVIMYLSYSTSLTKELYHVTAKVTHSLAGSTRQMTREYDFNRVYVRDK